MTHVGSQVDTRAGFIKALWTYFKVRKLQDPEDVKQVILDDTLRACLQATPPISDLSLSLARALSLSLSLSHTHTHTHTHTAPALPPSARASRHAPRPP